MIGTKSIYSAAVLSGVLCIASVYAGETAPPSAADAHTKALEERVRVLEKRLAEMETMLGRDAMPPPHRFGANPGNIDDIFERVQREMESNQGAFDWNNLFGQNSMPKQLRGMRRKPCLGVGVETVSDELKARFKNEVKEGAFVMSVYPNSAAEKAGITVGDAITSFDGKAIVNSSGVIDAVKTCGKGLHETTVSRHGESLLLKVQLNPENAAAALDDLLPPGPDGNLQRAQTEIKVSALELSDGLAKDLGLNDEQRKKMGDVLGKHANALSTEFDATKGGFSAQGNLNALAKKHADEAAKDLAGILDADQLKKWNDYRSTHSSVSFSQTMEMRGGNRLGGKRLDLDDDVKKPEPDRF